MLFAAVVDMSRRVAETSRRLEKIDLLAALLRQLDPEEVEIVVAYLSGYTRQGRIGIGYATLRGAAAEPAEAASLSIHELDRALIELGAVEGAGSERPTRRAGRHHGGGAREGVEYRFAGGAASSDDGR
jgi:DNA ligase-1